MMTRDNLIAILAVSVISLAHFGCPGPKTLQGVQTGREISVRNYEVQDHLGNVRLVIGDEMGSENTAQVKEARAYYPYGSAQEMNEGQNEHAFSFNGGEKDGDAGLEGDWVHLRFRELSTFAGRFSQPDPLALHKPFLSPYHFSGNNPVNSTDPEGLEDVRYKPRGAVFEIRSEGIHITSKEKFRQRFDKYMGQFFRQRIEVLNTPPRSEEKLHATLQKIKTAFFIDGATMQGYRSVEGLVIHSHGGGAMFGNLPKGTVYEAIAEEISNLRMGSLMGSVKFDPQAYILISSCQGGNKEALPHLIALARKSGLYVIATAGYINHMEEGDNDWKTPGREKEVTFFSDQAWFMVAPDGTTTQIRGTLERSGNYIHYDDIRRTIDETSKQQQMTEKRIEAGQDRSAPEFDDPDYEENTSVENGMSKQEKSP